MTQHRMFRILGLSSTYRSESVRVAASIVCRGTIAEPYTSVVSVREPITEERYAANILDTFIFVWISS